MLQMPVAGVLGAADSRGLAQQRPHSAHMAPAA